jgi:hypothetical protein
VQRRKRQNLIFVLTIAAWSKRQSMNSQRTNAEVLM